MDRAALNPSTSGPPPGTPLWVLFCLYCPSLSLPLRGSGAESPAFPHTQRSFHSQIEQRAFCGPVLPPSSTGV